MTQEDSKESHSESKYRKNNQKMFSFFYASILMSIGISIAIYGISTHGSSEKLLEYKIYYSLMYLSSVLIIVGLWIYIFINRKKTHEALIKGENEKFQFTFSNRGEKVNMFLRFGLAMFGISSLIYVSIATYIRYNDYYFTKIHSKKESGSIIIHGICQMLFITVQTIFILCFHRLVLLVYGNIMKFALIHLTMTNMLMWANASIEKVSNEFESNICKNAAYKNSCLLCVYLLPTVSEYTVISAAVIHEIYLRIGKASLIELEEKVTKKTSFSQFIKALPGLIGGAGIMFICIFTSISSVILHIFKKEDVWIYNFHSGQMIILNILGITFLVITYLKIKKMKFSVSLTKSSLDKNILFVSYIMAINFLLIVSITCGNSLRKKSVSKGQFDKLILRIFSMIFEMCQISLQTHFIIDCFQRCSYDNNQKEIKPGKNCLAILIGINFAMWFLWTLQIKNADIIYYKKNGSYVFLTSMHKSSITSLLHLFLQSSLPLGMLYRYHSSACLSDIYSKIYQTESERFVNHLRSGKLQNETGILYKEKNFKNKKVSFNNNGYESDDESISSMDAMSKKRSQSLGIIPMSILKNVKIKMMRRATLKNLEEAQYKFKSEQISHKMLNRKMSPESALPKRTKFEKEVRVLPNVHRMFHEGFFNVSFEDQNNANDYDSAYSI